MIAYKLKHSALPIIREWRISIHFCVFTVSLSLRLKDKAFLYKGFSPLIHSGDSNLLLFTNRKLPSWKNNSAIKQVYSASPVPTPFPAQQCIFQQYTFSELQPVTVRRRKVTSRVWLPGRAGLAKAMCVLAGQKKVEDADQFRPFLREVASHHFQQ